VCLKRLEKTGQDKERGRCDVLGVAGVMGKRQERSDMWKATWEAAVLPSMVTMSLKVRAAALVTEATAAL
jgi:hypothetical protein